MYRLIIGIILAIIIAIVFGKEINERVGWISFFVVLAITLLFQFTLKGTTDIYKIDQFEIVKLNDKYLNYVEISNLDDNKTDMLKVVKKQNDKLIFIDIDYYADSVFVKIDSTLITQLLKHIKKLNYLMIKHFLIGLQLI